MIHKYLLVILLSLLLSSIISFAAPTTTVPIGRTQQVIVVNVQLNTDSDNDGTIGPNDTAVKNSLPGCCVPVNQDFDQDGIQDALDWQIENTNVTPNIVGHFRPLSLTLSGPVGKIDMNKASVCFNYNASPPTADANGNYTTVASGNLRIWQRDANILRHPASITANGDFIPAKTWIPLATLGATDINFTDNLYIEGIKPSQVLGDDNITVYLSPDGSDPDPNTLDTTCPIRDKVMLTVFSVSLSTDKPSVAAGCIDSDAHRCNVIGQVMPSGLSGTMTFSITAPSGNNGNNAGFYTTTVGQYTISTAVAIATTGNSIGKAVAQLISSNKVTSNATIQAVSSINNIVCNTVTNIEFTMPSITWAQMPDSSYDSDGGAYSAAVILKNNNGDPVDQHNLQWQVTNITDEYGYVVYDINGDDADWIQWWYSDSTDNVDPATGIPYWIEDVYGCIIDSDNATDSQGTSTAEIQAGIFPATITYDFIDNTIYE